MARGVASAVTVVDKANDRFPQLQRRWFSIEKPISASDTGARTYTALAQPWHGPGIALAQPRGSYGRKWVMGLAKAAYRGGC